MIEHDESRQTMTRNPLAVSGNGEVVVFNSDGAQTLHRADAPTARKTCSRVHVPRARPNASTKARFRPRLPFVRGCPRGTAATSRTVTRGTSSFTTVRRDPESVATAPSKASACRCRRLQLP